MITKIEQLLAEVEAFAPKTAADVEAFRIKMLSKKGAISALMDEFKSVPAEQKRELGQKLNNLKNVATERINTLKEELGNAAAMSASKIDDMTRPGSEESVGSRHPISIVKNEIVGIFSRLGYTVADGPEIEDDWHVFSALNFPPEHPARDMQDTFFIESHPDLFATLWTAACLASLSFTISLLAHTHVHWVNDAIQPPHPLLPPSPHALNLFRVKE